MANFQARGFSYANLTAWLRNLNVAVVAVKMANGYLPYTSLDRVIDAIRESGAAIAGWHYYYGGVRYSNGEWYKTGVTPAQEAAASLEVIEMYRPIYWLLDCEREFKVWEQTRRMIELLAALKPNISIPVGLSTYRFPDLHPDFPWREAFTTSGGVDFNYPQVYWNQPTAGRPEFGPVPETNKSYHQYQDLYERLGIQPRPFIPAGRAYVGDGYPTPGPSAVEETIFMEHVKASGF